MSFLQLKEIKKDYKIEEKNINVLKDINLNFNIGEFVSLLGESGSGKTTLINLIGGLDLEYKGNIIINGQSIKNFSDKELDNYRKEKIGFIFQNFNLISYLTVLENVELSMIISSVNKTERKKRSVSLLCELGMKDHLNKKPNQLSGGQKQRVAIARALANNPDIILADEPTGSLDSETSEQIIKLLSNISKQGKLIIVVTHSIKVTEFSSRIIKIADGKIISDINKKEITNYNCNNYKIKFRFLKIVDAIKMGINNIKLKLKRNLLVSLGISIGVFSVIFILGLENGIYGFIENEVKNSIDPLIIEVTKNKYIKEDLVSSNLVINNNDFLDNDISYLKSIKGVDKLSLVTSYVMNVGFVYKNNNYIPMFFSTLDYLITPKKIIYGTMPKNGIIISYDLAKTITTKTIESLIGDEVIIQIPIMNDDGVLKYINYKLFIEGIFQINKERDNITGVYLQYNLLKNIFNNNNLKLSPNSIYIYVADIESVSKIKQILSDKGYETFRQEKIIEEFKEYLSIATIILIIIASISLLVSGIMILVVIYISVIERTKEIGVLRAMGARKKDIRRMFLVESSLIGIMGGILGVLLAKLLAIIGNKILFNIYNVSFINITFVYIIFGITLSTIISIVSGLIPANKAAYLDPVKSLRYE